MARPAVSALLYCFVWPRYPDPACFYPDSARTLPYPDPARTLPVLTSASPDHSPACSCYLVCPFATDP
ncbi:unnamed protein product, partial [Staurois parvus]